MSIYFGILPSDELNRQIDETHDIIENRTDEKFYPYQEKITRQIAHELLDEIFVKLIDVIDDPKRQQKMHKLVGNIHSAVDTMLKHILSEQENEKVLDAFHFLHDDCIFTDNDNQRRVGFLLDEEQGQQLKDYFEQAKASDKPHELLEKAMDIIIQANLQHFVGEFSKHLHLGVIKRKAVPIAETAINKASKVAIHKLLPDMQLDACERLVKHFEKFVIEK